MSALDSHSLSSASGIMTRDPDDGREWYAFSSGKFGREYYYNPKTQVVAWELPPGAHALPPPSSPEEQKQEEKGDDESDTESTSKSVPRELLLPTQTRTMEGSVGDVAGENVIFMGFIAFILVASVIVFIALQNEHPGGFFAATHDAFDGPVHGPLTEQESLDLYGEVEEAVQGAGGCVVPLAHLFIRRCSENPPFDAHRFAQSMMQ